MLVVSLAGCTTLAARRQFDAFPLLAPAAFGAEATRMQRVTIERASGGTSIALDAAVEVDASELRVAGFLLGQRVLLLVWNGEQLTESREPIVPASLEGPAVLRDLQLVYWPAEAIRADMPKGCRLETAAERRRILCDGTVVFEAERSDASPLGAARLRNNLGHYVISIESAQ